MMTLEERCKLATDCLPHAEYRHRLEALHAELLTMRKDAERWAIFVKHAKLGFHGAPSFDAAIRFPVFDHEDQTIAALVDRAISAMAKP